MEGRELHSKKSGGQFLDLRSPNCGDGETSRNNCAFTENQRILIITNKQKSILLVNHTYIHTDRQTDVHHRRKAKKKGGKKNL